MDQPLDFVAYASQGAIIGAFRCPRNHPRFVDSGPIQNDIFVFPRSSVRIRHAGGPAFIADQTRATIYNRGQLYDRGAVSEEGDRSDWFAVPREVAVEAVIANGLEPAARGPFPFAFAPISNRLYLEQRRLFERARRGGDAEAVNEGIYALLDDVVRSAAAVHRKRAPRRSEEEARRLAEEIRQMISARPGEPWPLSRLQEQFGVSAFRLCRAFRRATGSSIHAYIVSLRLRASLEHIESRDADLATVALDLGFSSHSHFTLAFRRTFGEPPSVCRNFVPPARF